MLNDIKIMGRLTRDPALTSTVDGDKVATFTLAVGREYKKDETDFFDCVAWNQKAEFVCKHLKKGQLIVVGGSMREKRWEDKYKQNRTSWSVQLKDIWFAEGKKKETEAVLDVLDDDEELPF